jgi:hypothetical protein
VQLREEDRIEWVVVISCRWTLICLNLVVPTSEGEELTIWDSKESEFASGLEFRGIYSDSINDLDWSATPDSQSILAVGFLHHVELLCQQRSTYFDEGPGWIKCWTVEIGSCVPLSRIRYILNQRIRLGSSRIRSATRYG